MAIGPCTTPPRRSPACSPPRHGRPGWPRPRRGGASGRCAAGWASAPPAPEAGVMPVTVNDLAAAKHDGRRFAMVTAYDYPTARLLAEAEIPILLVGDSVGNNALGYPSTLPVSMEDMLHHARAVARGAPDLLLVGD